MTASFKGLPGAPGCASGLAYRWHKPATYTPVSTVDMASALRNAFTAAHARLNSALRTADATLTPLLEAQRLMLDDPDLHDGAIALVEAGADPAVAVTTVSDQLAALLENAESEYFRDRAIDIRAIGRLVLEELTGGSLRNIPPGVIVLADELSPLDTAHLAETNVAALVTVRGGPTCHTAILARAWGIPAIVGVPEDTLTMIADGTPLLVDGDSGVLISHPDHEQMQATAPTAPRVQFAQRVPVYANIGSLTEATRARKLGAAGIGLLRTEFLFQQRTDPPSEDEQTEQYCAILRCMDGLPVTVRALDIGADKPVPFLPMANEPNPQLGLRGIRLLLQHRDLFVTQLRALVRAATTGPLKIMLPMVTMADEVCEARLLLDEAATDLGLPAPPLGVMIEVPMAALSAPELAIVSDFFSLGTNDLMQFLLAADRQHAGVGYLHVSDHRAAWRLIEPVITVAHMANIPVSVCGEWGADPQKLAQLLEFGIDAVSVSVGALPRVRAMFPD